MPQSVPSLAAVLMEFPDFSDPRSVLHPLQAMLLLACVVMLSGARGGGAIVEWVDEVERYAHRSTSSTPTAPASGTAPRRRPRSA